MKIIVMLLGFITVFALSMVGMLAATGNLNQDALDRLMGKKVEVKPGEAAAHGGEPAAAKEGGETIDPISRQMLKQREEIAAKEKELKDYEAQLNQRAAELDTLYQQVQAAKQELDSSVSEAEQKRQAEIETVANTLSNMKPKQAAERLESMPIPDIVEVMRKMKDKERGKVMGELKTELAAEVLSKMQEPPMYEPEPVPATGTMKTSPAKKTPEKTAVPSGE